ncbi:MAG: AAA family ATPase [Candidatus Marinimicrobia bacterium]|nr:AAA family ATPase [Candidatus Neomarinimicrobiota bacterium]
MAAKKIMIQATGFGTGAGKSLVVALLLKLFHDEGLKAAPFKTLNITTATYYQGDHEFGYAQALQAFAAHQTPDYRMNPFTIKPVSKNTYDLFLEGQCFKKSYNPKKDYFFELLKQPFRSKETFLPIKEAAKRCFDSLSQEYDILCLEGSGPAKLFGFGPLSDLFNLANMETAKMTHTPVLFVTDNFDSIPGILSFLSREEKEQIKGVILNKFLANDLLGAGVEKRYVKLGIKRLIAVYREKLGQEILGVIPYFQELEEIPDLDPLVPSERVPLDQWEKTLSSVTKIARKTINLQKIHKIMEG